MVQITKNNLFDRSLTNFQVIQMLDKLSLEVDPCGFSRVMDVVEVLTGSRDFLETSEYEKADQSQQYKLCFLKSVNGGRMLIEAKAELEKGAVNKGDVFKTFVLLRGLGMNLDSMLNLQNLHFTETEFEISVEYIKK